MTDDIQAWEAHLNPDAEWSCTCPDCYPEDIEDEDDDED